MVGIQLGQMSVGKFDDWVWITNILGAVIIGYENQAFSVS